MGTEHRFSNAGARVLSLALSETGQVLVSGGVDGCVRVWDLGDDPVTDPTTTLRFSNHQTASQSAWAAAVSTDASGSLIAGARGGHLRVWKRSPLQPDLTPLTNVDLQSHIYKVALSLDGSCLALGAENGLASAFDVGSSLRSVQHFRHDSAVQAVAMSGNGNLIVSATATGAVTMCDVRGGGRPRIMLEPDSADRNDPSSSSSFLALACSADGSIVIGAGTNGRVRVYDSRSRRALRDMAGDSRFPVMVMGANATATKAVTVPIRGPPTVWDCRQGRELCRIVQDGNTCDPVTTVAPRLAGAMSADGSRIVVGAGVDQDDISCIVRDPTISWPVMLKYAREQSPLQAVLSSSLREDRVFRLVDAFRPGICRF